MTDDEYTVDDLLEASREAVRYPDLEVVHLSYFDHLEIYLLTFGVGDDR